MGDAANKNRMETIVSVGRRVASMARIQATLSFPRPVENYCAKLFIMAYNKVMDNKELGKITKNIEKTVGKDMAGAIAADLGKIVTGFEANQDIIKSKDEEIAELKDLKEKLVASNGDLLRQVRQGREDDVTPKETAPEQPKNAAQPISLKDAFGPNGTFKH